MPRESSSGQVSGWGSTPVVPASNILGGYSKDGTRAYYPLGVSGNATSNASCAQAARWWIWTVTTPTIVTIRTRVQTLEAGATQRLATYNVGDDMLPTTLIEDYGTINASSTGNKSVVGSKPVLGRFAVALWSSNHTTVRYIRASLTWHTGSEIFGDSSAYQGDYGYCWGVNSVDYSGGFPAVAPAVTIQGLTTNLTMPAVSLS